MPFCCCKIDKATTGKKVDSVSVPKCELFVVFANCSHGGRNLFQSNHIDFTIIVTSIGDNRPIFHGCEVTFYDDVLHSCSRTENVAQRCCFIHGHDLISIHHCSKCCKRIDFGHDNVRTEASSTHSDTFSTMTVTCNNHGFASDEDGGSSQDSIKR